MENFTSALGNVTLKLSYTTETDKVARTVFQIMSFLCFSIFFYFIVIMLNVFFTTPHMQENPRYVLFAHMLINDTLYIITANFIIVSSMHSVYFPIISCFIIQCYAASLFLVTPYNLAVMSLERYIAICFPLRHLQLCTSRRAKYAIIVVWAIGLSICSVNFITIMYFAERSSYFIYDICAGTKVVNPIQNLVRSIVNILSFAGVALIIVFTYINVMLVARKVGSGRSSALKAGKTVMLHAFQLLLCMASLISTVSETYVQSYTIYLLLLNYILFMSLPRLLSPLIYGVRDEAFQKHIKKNCAISCVCRSQ